LGVLAKKQEKISRKNYFQKKKFEKIEKIWVWVKAAITFTFDIDTSIENLLTENEERTFRIKNLRIN